MIAADLLTEAATLVSGAKQSEHGSPEDTFRRIAALWSAYLDREVSPTDVCQLMVLLKIGRALARPKKDDYLDSVGYGSLAYQMAFPAAAVKRECETCAHGAFEGVQCSSRERCFDFNKWSAK
jgi:hypothetical protein